MKKTLTPEQLADTKRLKDIYESKKKQLGITHEKLAEEFGMTSAAISHYLNGINALNLEVARKFANKLEVTIADFSPSLDTEARELLTAVFGKNAVLINDAAPNKQYPLLSGIETGSGSEEFASYYHHAQRYGASIGVTCSPRAFWIAVKNDSMTSPNGLISVPQGMIILIDPTVKPVSGKFVVAILDGEKEPIFRQLIKEGYHHYLKPLNPQYKMIPLDDNIHILGVVVDAIITQLP
ncbi:MAG: helix-turn-helix domain-containing protein [Enterobacteriaceae bacterium]|jgi:SOS-response transcriptional repressor LexA|nr:helix-turn-helix domain-containing protein [Enterobacteriaceae bacterium]